LKRIPKRRRAPELLRPKQLTDRSFAIIETISRYRFLGTKDLIHLVGGNEDVTHRHLQQLYHRSLIGRLILPQNGNNAEFIYLLDNTPALRELCIRSGIPQEKFDWKQIKSNHDKYSEGKLGNGLDAEGKFLFLRHELMISEFRAGIERGCKSSDGAVLLERFQQGPEIHSSVRLASGKTLPHRPDAFFTLRFPNAPEGQQRSNFFYEADRSTSSIPRLREKFEAHLHFLLQGKHSEAFDIKRIRAVIVETITASRAEQLKSLAAELAAHEPLAGTLFWIANSGTRDTKESPFPQVFQCAADSRVRSLLD
jgi:hypothetical protein